MTDDLTGEFNRSVSLSIIVPVYNERHLVEASLRRVLDLECPTISGLELVVVDDHSTDGSYEILQKFAESESRIKLVRHPKNRGKGDAIRTAIPLVTGDITIVHDADLEYDPSDISAIMVPFIEEGADAVFGSRYLAGPYRQALMFKHSNMNRAITLLSNFFTDLDLTDVETCYKAVRTPLLKSLPIRSNDFRFEIEIASKLAKRRARVFEVPIRYAPRSYEEGKKIGPVDGLLALTAIVRYWLVDDLYAEDEYGSHIRPAPDRTRQFTGWMADALRPWVGDHVLELGAGTGAMTNHFIPRSRYVAGDINPHYLHYLRSYAAGKPYLEVKRIDAGDPADFEELQGQFDTVLMLNVLEHVDDPVQTLANISSALKSGGRAIILVPQHAWLHGTLDDALEHRERYSRDSFRDSILSAGFEIEELSDFDRFSVPGWWLNGRVLKTRKFSRLQLKVVDTLMPVLKHVDDKLPWTGQSLIAVARKP